MKIPTMPDTGKITRELEQMINSLEPIVDQLIDESLKQDKSVKAEKIIETLMALNRTKEIIEYSKKLAPVKQVQEQMALQTAKNLELGFYRKISPKIWELNNGR